MDSAFLGAPTSTARATQAKRQIGALAHEVPKRDRDGVVGRRDDGVGNYIAPEKRCIPEEAMSVRHEAAGSEVIGEGAEHVCPPDDS